MAAIEMLHPRFTPLSEGDYHARLSNITGVAVVLFSNASCGACRVWKRLLPEALASLSTHFYEVDVALATGLARYFEIFHLPTIYLYRDGRFHAELQSEARADAVVTAARALLTAPAQEEP